MRLKERRRQERAKYAAVVRRDPRYGSSCHGAAALELLLGQRPASVLDVGCGDNRFVRELRSRGVAALGADFVHPGADLHAAAHALPVCDAAVEWVTAFDVLEHLLPEEVDAVLREFARVARTGWLFSISHRDSRVRGPRGETLHPTVRPRAWWRQQLSRWIDVREDAGYVWGRLHGRSTCAQTVSSSAGGRSPRFQNRATGR